MVVTRGSDSGVDGSDSPRLSDDEIRELITTKVTLAVKEVIRGVRVYKDHAD